MGKPETTNDFEELKFEDIVVYIHKNILDNYLKSDELYFYIEGYGRHKIVFNRIMGLD